MSTEQCVLFLFVIGIYVATNKMHNATASYCLYHKSIKDETVHALSMVPIYDKSALQPLSLHTYV